MTNEKHLIRYLTNSWSDSFGKPWSEYGYQCPGCEEVFPEPPPKSQVQNSYRWIFSYDPAEYADAHYDQCFKFRLVEAIKDLEATLQPVQQEITWVESPNSYKIVSFSGAGRTFYRAMQPGDTFTISGGSITITP